MVWSQHMCHEQGCPWMLPELTWLIFPTVSQLWCLWFSLPKAPDSPLSGRTVSHSVPWEMKILWI